MVTVMIPDMFSSFLSVPPRVNPLYAEVKRESETWISEKLSMDPKMCRKIQKLDFAWFCSIAAPDAAKEDLRTLCDWGNWVFPFDDMFDNGHLRADIEMGRQFLDSLLSSMREGHAGNRQKSVLVEIHDTVWHRVVKKSPQYVQRRFADAMEQYCEGIMEHVSDYFEDNIPSLEQYMDVRRRGVGVAPVLTLIECTDEIKIPDKVYNNKHFQELRRVGIDVVLIQNDVLSYAKEQAEGVPHNLITVLRAKGVLTQRAFDMAAEMLKQCHRDWFLAQAELPHFGEAVDREVQNYIFAIQQVMVASLNWHYKSDRYFGKQKDTVRKTRMIAVLE
ncbi:related to pentalenene synthase [Phialocephala subalpina]|uniref:Terpene synthase n=1 Tax=Phialocephala subalpina TaxID=576137 RepID=A0A1L7WMZ8_9HELO|nr:related to pentalenene synthase [Phialocephala subalpina]